LRTFFQKYPSKDILCNAFLELGARSEHRQQTEPLDFYGSRKRVMRASRDSSRRIDIPSGGDSRLIGCLNSLPIDQIRPIQDRVWLITDVVVAETPADML